MAQAVALRAPANKWAIAGTVVLSSFVVVMDVSIVNMAMPQTLGECGVTLDAITWVPIAYSIAEIILVTMAAWCSLLFGRKRFYILSFSICHYDGLQRCVLDDRYTLRGGTAFPDHAGRPIWGAICSSQGPGKSPRGLSSPEKTFSCSGH